MISKGDDFLALCRSMLLIRYFEESLIGMHAQGHFRGHYHVYIGQEATGVGASSCLEPGDYVFTTHRNHGHLLARGADPGRLFAEILGRSDGYNKGKGGTFHVAAAALGIPHTSAVVAGMIPLATGAAFAAKRKGGGQLSLCFFGDGALEEGAAAESFNLASLWKLPVIYLCENNGKYGREKSSGLVQSSTLAAYPLTDLPKTYGIPAAQVDGSDLRAVRRMVLEAAQRARAGEGPQFIEGQTVRWPGNEGRWPAIPIATDVSLAWDSAVIPDDVKQWYQEKDPVLRFVRELIEDGKATQQAIIDIEADVKRIVSQGIEFALSSPFPEPETAVQDILA
jgi:pyruvate dehydrogenase E1 component alpha subunit